MKQYELINLATNETVMIDTYKNIAKHLSEPLHNVIASHMQKLPIAGHAVIENDNELEVVFSKYIGGK